MLSSSIAELDISTSYDHGANSYIQKPVESALFLETARTLGIYWLGMNQQTLTPAN